MTIAICDDDERQRGLLRTYCEACFAADPSCKILEWESGRKCLDGQWPDILLLDIEMDGMDGIAVKEELERRGANTRILFVTGHEEYMPDAFGRNVVRFLKKPLRYENFIQAIRHVMRQDTELGRFLRVRATDGWRRIPLRDVLYIEAKGKDVDFHTTNGKVAAIDRRGISDWGKELLPEDFVQTHKSYLVSLAHVKEVTSDILLDNGGRVRMSRMRKQEVLERYWDYLERHLS